MFRALFSPRMVALHLLGLVAVTAAGWLGFWQYDAWQTRRDAEAEDLAHAAPLPLDQVMSSDAAFPGDAVGRPVTFRGTWVTGSTLFVADRAHQGEVGYWVVAPVTVCDSDRPCGSDDPAMLVVRGWAPDPGSAPTEPTGAVSVTGWLQPSEGTGREDPDPVDDVLSEVRIPDVLQHVDQDLYGGYVISADATPGLAQVGPDSLPEPETFTALRNLLYALEWWVFGGFALFVWWRWCSDETKRARPAATGSTSDPAPEDAGVPSSP